MEEMVKSLQTLIKALEGGNMMGAPGSLTQGSSLQVEDLSPVMHNTTFQDKHLILQKMIDSSPAKGTLVQFNRQLSYGQFGGTAQVEGNVGQEDTSDYVRIVVPMAFYSSIRRVTLVADMVETSDGRKASERVAADASKKLAADIEFDTFRGLADFSNTGVFDGNPAVTPMLPGIHGIDLQVRQSDAQRQSQDLMFAEFGSSESVVINGGGVLTQGIIEDAAVKSQLNFGNAEKLITDPRALASYNKISFGKERIVLAGSAQEGTGASLRKQFVSSGDVELVSSHFLRGKYQPAPIRKASPLAPTHSGASATTSGVVTPFGAGDKYYYFVTAGNEAGESGKSAAAQVTVTNAGDEVQVTITPNGSGNTARFFNVYRSVNNGSSTNPKFIGRIMNSGAATTVFHDYGNRLPGSVVSFLLQADSHEFRELAPYSRMKLAVTDLSTPEAYYRFTTLTSLLPRQNVLVDNITP